MEINRARKRDGKCVRMSQLSHSENEILRQNVHSHETIRQASDALVAQDVEITALREQLRSFHSMEAETEEILKDLETVCKRSQDLEQVTQQHQDQSRAEASLYHQLRDALERNQQWQAYERQREGRVKRLLARLSWLEEQLNRANEGLSRHKEAHSDEMRRRDEEMQQHYDKLLHNANTQRDELREQVSSAHQRMEDMQWRCEATQREVEEVEQQVEAERLQTRKSVQEERRRCGLKEDTLRAEALELHSSLELEARRSAELQLQVNLLQKSMVNYEEDQRRITVLEHQMETSSKTLEDERRECLCLQKQLHKVLKNLHKTGRHVAQRSQKERQGATAGPDEASSRLHSNNNRPKPSKQSVPSAPPPHTPPDLLDETFLECPGCQAMYPTSRYAELLAHLERCLD